MGENPAEAPELPRGCSRRIPRLFPHLEMCRQPQNELLLSQQVLKLLLLVLSSKSRQWLGKGGDNRTMEENLDTGEFLFFTAVVVCSREFHLFSLFIHFIKIII